MKKISFPYEDKSSVIFKTIKRPIAIVDFWSARRKRWIKYTMIVDTGADYTILPFSAATNLGVDVKKECKKFRTLGIGGTETVYFLNEFKIKIGDWTLKIPLGFLKRDNIPPLLGRHKCLDVFNMLFSEHITYFSIPKK